MGAVVFSDVAGFVVRGPEHVQGTVGATSPLPARLAQCLETCQSGSDVPCFLIAVMRMSTPQLLRLFEVVEGEWRGAPFQTGRVPFNAECCS